METIWIITWWDPRKHAWWVEKVIHEIVKPLQKKYNLSYIFIDKENFHEKTGDIEYCGIKSFWISPFNILLFAWKLKRFKFDLIIDNTWVANVYNNLDKKTKIIYICHWIAWWAIRDLNVGSRMLKIKYFIYYFFIHLLWKITYRKADLIIVAPRWWKELLHRYYGVQKSKIKVIYNGIDFVSKSIKPFDGILKIIFISNNHPRRGIHRLEIVAKALKKEKVIFKIIWSQYSNPHTIKNIHYLWTLVGEEKYKELIDSDVVFMPSCYEGQNLSVLEWMSVGCIPLVSTNTNTNMIEWTELEQFISPNNDINFYIEKITYLLQNHQKIDALKKMSQNKVKDYTRDNQSKKYLEEIDDLLGE